MLIIGLTGSIAMGKSTVAGLFAKHGTPVISADDIVHDLYQKSAAPLVEQAFPGSTVTDSNSGARHVDRAALSDILSKEPRGFARLEALIHPLVRRQEWAFIQSHNQTGSPFVIIEIPLLFETGADRQMDRVVIASAPDDIQRQRALARPGMTEDKFKLLLSRQMPNDQKRQKADYIINTGCDIKETEKEVISLITELTTLSQQPSTAFSLWQTQMASDPGAD